MKYLLFLLVFSFNSYSSTGQLKKLLSTEKLKKSAVSEIKKLVENSPKKMVPILISTMKDNTKSEQARWLSTVLIGKTMGRRSLDLMSKYAYHPDVILRMASLKVLLSLQAKKKVKIFESALFDKSLLVRQQALESVKLLNLTSLGKKVLAMLFDKKNYTLQGKKLKRDPIMIDVVKVLGDLGYQKSKSLLVKMRSKKRYKDLHRAIDYSLAKLN